MRRRLLNLLTALSLVLCVAVCVLWVRSHWRADHFQYGRVQFPGLRMTEDGYNATSARGGLSLSWGHRQYAFPSVAEADQVRSRIGRAEGRFHFEARTLSWMQYAGGFYELGGGRLHVGFGWRSFDSVSTSGGRPLVERGWQAVLPWPALALLMAMLPLSRLWLFSRRARRRRRVGAGLCPSCGYDLRATPDCCPECGHQPGPARNPSGV